MSDKYIALIPAYKPEPVLVELLKELIASGFECVVVDDGGGDEYSAIFDQAKELATVLTHPVNRGKGAAMKTGFEYVQKNFPTDAVVVTVDADGQHKVSDALKICREANSLGNALVLGGREFKGQIPLRSKLGNSITRFVYMLSTGLKVHDTQTGLRAFPASLIPRLISISGDRYEYEMNVLLEFARHKIPIREISIETVYIGKNESSHFHPLKDSMRIYKEILKFSASSFIGFLTDYLIYLILSMLSFKVTTANIVARVVSSVVNFTINRKFVFKSKGPLIKDAIKYFLLAALILVFNTALLNFFVHGLNINKLVAKIITEICLYFFSWIVQRLLVFKTKK